MLKKQKVAIICGGPSAERGISMNSARSIFDNLDKEKYEISIIYYNPKIEPYLISPLQIYSNTPLDFDFKLKGSKLKLSREKLKIFLSKIDIAIPAIHGLFGEDGQLQKILEEQKVKYTGSGPEACHNTSDKYICQKILKDNGFYTVPNWVLRRGEPQPSLPRGEYVIKPLHGGSSIGVHYFSSAEDLKNKLIHVFAHEDESIIEPLCIGKEFTIIVLDNREGEPVALLPTEIEFGQDRFFDYRKKYLASTDTRYHTPARYSKETTDLIRKEAARAFKCLGMKDFGRIDGWIMPDGKIWFSDINAISGMEQNSFLFQQAALLGLSHGQLIDYIINKKISGKPASKDKKRENIPVIFGGKTAERQISVVSGTNVWIKLRTSKKYLPVPLVLTRNNEIYEIPQFICLHHTVEEIEEKIEHLKKSGNFEKILHLSEPILKSLKINKNDLREKLFIPQKTNLHEIAKKYKFLFLGLHGGAGEDGTIQKQLDIMKLPYNGPGPLSSKLCMDKFETGKAIEKANIRGVTVAIKVLLNLDGNIDNLWEKIHKCGIKIPLIIKPRGDGCSAGVIKIVTYDQFRKAIEYFKSDHKFIPENSIHENHGKIELPHNKINEILIEEYIKTDKVNLENLKIDWKKINNIIEVTIGVIGPKNDLNIFYPSQTIASQEILSLEEKFMGGTGINLTPPPPPHVKPEAIKRAQQNLKKVAEILDIEGYSRIDAFMNTKTGDLIIIEANTLPGLTPSTVIYHQALAENPPMEPLKLIEKIIEIGKDRFNVSAKKIQK
jgi:D-alanine--D-alanine ligase